MLVSRNQLYKNTAFYTGTSLHLLIASAAVATVTSQPPGLWVSSFFPFICFKKNQTSDSAIMAFYNFYLFIYFLQMHVSDLFRCVYVSLFLSEILDVVSDWLYSTGVSAGLQLGRSQHDVAQWFWHHSQPLRTGGDWVMTFELCTLLFRETRNRL